MVGTTETSGVPLGGIGAGCIEMGPDGALRNVTINNNRIRATRIPSLPGSFLAVRAATQGVTATRLLQTEVPPCFTQASIPAPVLAKEQIFFDGLYPWAKYQLLDSAFPLRLEWSAVAPVIPYDLDACGLPLIFFRLRVRNPNDVPAEFSAAFTWENLCGCTAEAFPQERGGIRLVYIPEERENEGMSAPRLRGLECGITTDHQNNAEGQYCVAAKEFDDGELSIMTWNNAAPKQTRAFWSAFDAEGRLGNHLSRDAEAHAASVCVTVPVEPQSSRHVLFVLTWHCPRFELDGNSLGNRYTNHFSNAVDTAAYGLKHNQYFFQAVNDWHQRMLRATTPLWLNRMLVNSACVLSTNTIYAKDGRFHFFESPASPVAGALGQRLYSSLTPLLLFPELEQRELLTLAETPQAGNHQLLREPALYPVSAPEAESAHAVEAHAFFVLMAYRDYIMTGRRMTLDALYPRVSEALQRTLEFDANDDGLPEQQTESATFARWRLDGLSSYTAGLWVAALKAGAELARLSGHDEEAERFSEWYVHAAQHFDAAFWCESEGHFLLTAGAAQQTSPSACHTAQLAGAWYLDFLNLGPHVSHQKIDRALDAIHARCEKRFGTILAAQPDGTPSASLAAPGTEGDPGLAWPYVTAACHAAFNIHRGRADRGLYSIQKVHKILDVRKGRTFNPPLAWNLNEERPVHDADERHCAAGALWHVWYALLGFFLNVPEQTLWFRPNLPKDVTQLFASFPTPLCWGWANFRESLGHPYSQRLQLAFDSPVQIRAIMLRVPRDVRRLAVQCITPAGQEKFELSTHTDGERRTLEIQFPRPILIGKETTLRIRESRDAS